MALALTDVANTGLLALFVMGTKISDITDGCAATIALVGPSHLYLSRDGRH
jgi:hypothetical protein